MSDKIRRIIGVDPGSEESGMVVLDDCRIVVALNVANVAQVYDKISKYSLNCNLTIAVEDIKPYSLRLTSQVIDTCKFIGELTYRLRNEAGINVVMVSRYEVKKWIFDSFYDLCLPFIDKKIHKKGFDASDIETKLPVRVWSDGEVWKARKASFVFIDDKIVTEAMKQLYKIPLPNKGKGYQFGLQTHSWQALATASYFASLEL